MEVQAQYVILLSVSIYFKAQNILLI